jgi:hypothetical protein
VVQALKITIARLKEQRFGANPEKIEREIEQLELALGEPRDLSRRRRRGDRGGPAGERGRFGLRVRHTRQRPGAAASSASSMTRRARPSCSIRANAARSRRLRPVGEDVAEILGGGATDIGHTIHPHLTLSETVNSAAEMFEGAITVMMPAKENSAAQFAEACCRKRTRGAWGDRVESSRSPPSPPGRQSSTVAALPVSPARATAFAATAKS